MSSYPRTMPESPRMFCAQVVRSRRLSPAFQRVTITGPELDDFDFAGLDHWFRLFLPQDPQGPFPLPVVEGRTWWQPYLDIDEAVRPHCSNYTVADLRRTEGGTELDVDVVLHWDETGELCGGVAIWATSARPGDPLALLDQGVLFDPPADARELVLVTDETGLPGVRGIVRGLPADARGRIYVEVPGAGDVEDWPVPSGMSIVWLPREDAHARPGALALAALQADPAPSPESYAYVVGESALATGGRRHLVRAGLAKDRIFFSGFWKQEKARTPQPAAA